VRLRVTATVEKDVEITAMNKREAENKAGKEATPDFSGAVVQTKVVRVREIS